METDGLLNSLPAGGPIEDSHESKALQTGSSIDISLLAAPSLVLIRAQTPTDAFLTFNSAACTCAPFPDAGRGAPVPSDNGDMGEGVVRPASREDGGTAARGKLVDDEGPDNRISFPSGRSSLMPLVPHIHPFLMKHGAAALTVLVLVLFLPLLHLVRWSEVSLVGLYRWEEQKLHLHDRLSLICLLLSCGFAVYWFWPTCFLAYRRAREKLHVHLRATPLSKQHAGQPLNQKMGGILVLINPSSGKSHAINEYKETIQPVRLTAEEEQFPSFLLI